MLSVLDDSKLTVNVSEISYKSTSQIILSSHFFDIFEFNQVNLLEYFSRLLIEKLYQVTHSFLDKLKIQSF